MDSRIINEFAEKDRLRVIETIKAGLDRVLRKENRFKPIDISTLHAGKSKHREY